MKSPDAVVGVDIGSSKIATVIGHMEDEVLNILGVSEVPSKGIKKGQIVNIEEAANAINSALDSAERMAGLSAEKAFVSISGINIEGENSKGVVAVSQSGGEITEYDVERVLEAAGAVSLPATREIIHVVPKTFTVDGEGGIKDPVGMAGVRLEVDTHIITANNATIRNIERILNQEAGVEIQALIFSGLASSLATLSDTEKELGVIMADVGAGVTNIAVYVDGALSYTSVIPIGARHITNDLAIGLRISLESAEKIKLYLSEDKKRKGEGQKKEEDDLNLEHLNIPEDIRKSSRKTLTEGIIRPRLNELFTMIAIEIKKSGFATQTPAGIVVTGGGAKTVGVEDAAKRMLSMPVRIGYPTNITGLIDDVETPTFSTSVGLLRSSENYKVTEPSFSIGNLFGNFNLNFLGGDTIKKIKKMISKFIPL